MYEIERLVSLGMDYETAEETAYWYLSQGDTFGFERYVQEMEERAYYERFCND